MTYIVMAFVLVSSALFQVTLPSFACLGQAKAPFLLAAVLYYALSRDTPTMLVAAFAAGLLQDVLTPMMPLGYSVFSFCLVGGVVGLFRKMVLTESFLTSATFGAAAGVAVTIVLYIMLLGQGLVVCPVRRVALRALAVGMLGIVCAPIVFAFALKLDGVVGNVEVRESIDGLE
ncbi:hypothetical protein ACFLQU_02660 [Verrucomicrobiota bacterium]